jgi:hypothetical protein
MNFRIFRLVLVPLLMLAGVRAVHGQAKDVRVEAGKAEPTKVDYVLQPQDVIRVLVFQELSGQPAGHGQRGRIRPAHGQHRRPGQLARGDRIPA